MLHSPYYLPYPSGGTQQTCQPHSSFTKFWRTIKHFGVITAANYGKKTEKDTYDKNSSY